MDSELWVNVDKHAETLLRELQSEMRSIRDADLKLLPFFFTISAFVLSANLLTIPNAKTPSTVLWVGIPSLLFLCIFWWQLHGLIEYNHNKYLALGKLVREIWDGWKVTKFCKPDQGSSPYGEGSGFKKTQLLIAYCAIAVVIIVGAIAWLKLFCQGFTSGA